MSGLRGTIALTGLALKRDRLKLPAYVLGPAVLMAGMVAMWRGETHQALVEEIELFAGTPALRIFGVVSGASIGSAFMTRGYLLLAVLAALMSALAVVRHTRQNEETGRAELIGAAAVGRHAGLAAAVIVTVGANIVLAGLLGLAGIATGLPAVGSLMAGLAVGAFGIVFAGVAAVTVQLSSTTRGASGLAAAVLGLAFVVSGLGNMLGTVDASGQRVVSAWPSWLSPMGWGQQMRPFGGDIWWPLGLFAVAFVVLVGVAILLATRRDVGSGILAARRGHAQASPRLLSPLGLAWRLQRGALLAWAAALAGFGLIFGAIIDEIKDTGGATADFYARMTGSDEMVEAWGTSMVEMAGMVVAVYAVQVLLRMRAEEADGPLEPILGDRGEPAAVDDQPRPQRRAGRTRAAPRLRGEHGPRGRTGARRRPGATSRTRRGGPRPVAGNHGDRRSRCCGHRTAAALGRRGVVGGGDGGHPARPVVRGRDLPAAALGAGPLAVHPHPEGTRGRHHRSTQLLASSRSPQSLVLAGLAAFRRRNLALPV